MISSEHLTEVREAVAKTGRDVTLVAAVKTQTCETVEQFHRMAPDFVLGENRVQEFNEHYREGTRWHFIGQLQTNKVKYLVGRTELIHSLDRDELAREIERQAAKHGIVQDCLLEVNMGGELTKGGVAPAEVADFLHSVEGYAHIRVRGLMSVLPQAEETELRKLYASLRSLFESTKELDTANYSADYLSAGMSGDYKIALEYGSNMIRLGRTLFGERVYPAATERR